MTLKESDGPSSKKEIMQIKLDEQNRKCCKIQWDEGSSVYY